MKMPEIKQKAKQVGVKANGKKADVIRRIQESESNDPCFGTKDVCGQVDCCWREDCVPEEVLG